MELTQCINYLLTTAQHSVFQYLNGKLSEYDVTPSQYGVLSCLWQREFATPKQISEILCLETSTISGTDKDGNELFSHTYHYIGMEPVHGLYEFESDDADSGEFTYFFLAPDTSAETYHIEFRYGSDAEALSQYDAGEYAYWVASGISTDCDQTMIDNCIELFCTENLAG